MLLTDLFDLSLVGRAEAPALDVDVSGAGPVTLTFGEIDARAWRMARVLERRGVRPGDRVAVHLPNGIEFIDLFLACLRLGAIFVPINVLYREREIAHIATDAEPALLVGRDASRAFYPPETPLLSMEHLSAAADDVGEATADLVLSLRSRREAIDGSSPAVIIYTSGTTGRSKGAVLSHDNFLANVTAIVSCWRISEADRYLAVLPLFHVHGLGNGICAWLAAGCRMRLVERFDHHRAVDLFESFLPTLFFGVPTIYTRLLEIPDAAARRIGSRMRLFVSGSAPLPAQVFEAFAARFGHTILERYGMSETLMLISNPYVAERRAGTVGWPLPGVSVRLVDGEGRSVPTGEVGQVLVRGSNVFRGYWRDEAASASAFDAGWFRTGDLAIRSADGYYTLTGRASDLIISGGFNIYPREIEELLVEFTGVHEAAVVGAPDPRRGEVPVAYVVAGGDFDPEAARTFCSQSLASFKVPRAFVRVDALPRNALGKIQKHLLPPLDPR